MNRWHIYTMVYDQYIVYLIGLLSMKFIPRTYKVDPMHPIPWLSPET